MVNFIWSLEFRKIVLALVGFGVFSMVLFCCGGRYRLVWNFMLKFRCLVLVRELVIKEVG